MNMTHPGLPPLWAWIVVCGMIAITLKTFLFSTSGTFSFKTWQIKNIPLVGDLLQAMSTKLWVLITLKLVFLLLFVLVIVAGLFGTPIAERNIATVLTWNIWWAGLIFSIFLFGSAWCAICPWDFIVQIMVKHRIFHRSDSNFSLELRVPKWLRSVWPALWLFIGFTWLELGFGVTTSPHMTAVLALLMVVLATISLAIYERRAFCRFFCPVGRTVGCYSQLSAIELRPIEIETCKSCKTLDCYHGNETIEPCPTHLVMGSLTQNSYCTSCGNCVKSCPEENIAWRFRSPSVEAISSGRPHYDEAWFMLGLLALTGLHGVTMLPVWETWMTQLSQLIGDSGQLLWSFSIGLIAIIIMLSGFYCIAVWITQRMLNKSFEYKRLFSTFSFVSLPIAFAYHLAHNLNHFIREGAGFIALFSNPLGINTVPLSMLEKHQRQMHMLIPQDVLYGIQALLLVLGFWVAVQVIRHRSAKIIINSQAVPLQKFWPIVIFAMLITGFHLCLLMQSMSMRM